MDLDAMKFLISASRRMLYREGLDSQVGGHVSMRIPGEDAYLVTPYQYLDETLPEHVAKVAFHYTVLEQGSIHVSPGVNFHADVYQARPEVGCVIHTHSNYLSVLSTTDVPFGMYYVYAAMFLDDVVSFKDDGFLTPENEGPAMAQQLGPHRAMIMGHHGALHVADTVENATAEAIALELCARRQVEAMAVGGKPMDDDIALSYRDAYLRYGFRKNLWDANFRRLRASDPDLFAATGR